jgi:hypothetical protein
MPVRRIEVAMGSYLSFISIAALLLVGFPALAIECNRDQFSVFAIDGELIASSGGGGTRSADLEKGEEVLQKASRGCVAMVSTNRRLLVVSALGGPWISVLYQLNETPAYELLVGEQVGIAISDRRIVGYDPRTTQVVALDIGAQESVTHWIAGDRIAAVATDRRVIGYSVGLSTFAERTLRLKEKPGALDSGSDVVTVITGERVLTLRSGAGYWAERKRPIR